jgi:hypothetical protein
MRERAHRNEPDAVCRGRPCPTLFQFPASPFSLLERITTTKFSLCLSALFLIACVAGAEAADICDAVALREVRAIENSNAIIKRGEHDTGITEYRVEKKTGVKSFCSHGGYCYPAYATVNGREVESLYLTNCKIDKSFYEDIVFIIYSVVVIRSKVPTAKLLCLRFIGRVGENPVESLVNKSFRGEALCLRHGDELGFFLRLKRQSDGHERAFP